MRRHRPGKALGTESWPDVKQQTADTVCACTRVHVHAHTCAAWGVDTLISLCRQGTGAEHGV